MVVVKEHNIVDLCRKMGVQGTPGFMQDEQVQGVCNVLSLCDSYLEVKAFLGACHYIQGNKFLGRTTVRYYATRFVDIGECIVIVNSESWMTSGYGYYNIIIAPQFKVYKDHNYVKSESIGLTHDFAVLVPKMVTRPHDRHHMLCAVEVDGHAVHKDRRSQDALRDRGLSYPVIRVLEEEDMLLSWFRFLDPGHLECRVHTDDGTVYQQAI